MKTHIWLSAAFFVIAAFLFFLSLLSGQSGFALFLIFPVFYSTGPLGALATLFLFIGFLLLFFAPFAGFSHAEHHGNYDCKRVDNEHLGMVENKPERRYGGVILIGPIPIVFGSDANHAMTAVIIAIVILMCMAMLLIFTGI